MLSSKVNSHLCWISFLILCWTNPILSRQWSEGDIRLVGGSKKFLGTVLIFHNGKWGAVCDDQWGVEHATVVCRQLGYTAALKATLRSKYGPGSSRTWLSQVNCTGSEERLDKCQFHGYNRPGQYKCLGLSRSAGVICNAVLSKSTKSQKNVKVNAKSAGNKAASKTSNKPSKRRIKARTGAKKHKAENVQAILATSSTKSNDSSRVNSSRFASETGQVKDSTKQAAPISGNDLISEANTMKDTESTTSKTVSQSTLVATTTTTSTSEAMTTAHLSASASLSTAAEILKTLSTTTVSDSQLTHRTNSAESAGLKHISSHEENEMNDTASRNASQISTSEFVHFNISAETNSSEYVSSYDSMKKDAADGFQLDMEPYNETQADPENKPSEKDALPVKNLEIKLAGGRYQWEGYLLVKVADNVWGTICSDHWSLTEAMVACNQIEEHGKAKQALLSAYFGGAEFTKVFYSIQCVGRETDLASCNLTKSDEGPSCSKKTAVAGIVCSHHLPDLIPNLRVVEESLRLQDHPLYYLQCSMEENCLASSAYTLRETNLAWRSQMRRLMRFSTVVHNRGLADFKPLMPRGMWKWHACHMHYHSMEVFAHYDILDAKGKRLAEGSKASFCLEDTTCDNGVHPQYNCRGFAEQGLSVNCSDNYLYDIDCQWIDISDIKPGHYTFLIEVNPDMIVAESNFDNNVVSCHLYYNGYFASATNCHFESLLDYKLTRKG